MGSSQEKNPFCVLRQKHFHRENHGGVLFCGQQSHCIYFLNIVSASVKYPEAINLLISF